MKFLKTIVTLTLCFTLALAMRAGIRRHFPDTYNFVWGAAEKPVDKTTKKGERDPEKTVVNEIARSETNNDRAVRSQNGQSEKEAVFATGSMRGRGRTIVQMSDGSVRTDRDNEAKKPARLTMVTSTFADFDGQRYWFKPSPKTEPKTIIAPSPTPPQAQESPVIAAPTSGSVGVPSEDEARSREAKNSPSEVQKSSMSAFDSKTVRRRASVGAVATQPPKPLQGQKTGR
jgi:hypothetical protein